MSYSMNWSYSQCAIIMFVIMNPKLTRSLYASAKKVKPIDPLAWMLVAILIVFESWEQHCTFARSHASRHEHYYIQIIPLNYRSQCHHITHLPSAGGCARSHKVSCSSWESRFIPPHGAPGSGYVRRSLSYGLENLWVNKMVAEVNESGTDTYSFQTRRGWSGR